MANRFARVTEIWTPSASLDVFSTVVEVFKNGEPVDAATLGPTADNYVVNHKFNEFDVVRVVVTVLDAAGNKASAEDNFSIDAFPDVEAPLPVTGLTHVVDVVEEVVEG